MKQTFINQFTRPYNEGLKDLSDKVHAHQDSLQEKLRYNNTLISEILFELDIFKAIYNQLTGGITHSRIYNVRPTSTSLSDNTSFIENSYEFDMYLDKNPKEFEDSHVTSATVFKVHGVYAPVLKLTIDSHDTSSQSVVIDMNLVWNFEDVLLRNINEISYTFTDKGFKALFEIYYSFTECKFIVGTLKSVKAIWNDTAAELTDLRDKRDMLYTVLGVKEFEKNDILQGIRDDKVVIYDQSILNALDTYFDKIIKK